MLQGLVLCTVVIGGLPSFDRVLGTGVASPVVRGSQPPQDLSLALSTLPLQKAGHPTRLCYVPFHTSARGVSTAKQIPAATSNIGASPVLW